MGTKLTDVQEERVRCLLSLAAHIGGPLGYAVQEAMWILVVPEDEREPLTRVIEQRVGVKL